MCDAPDHIMTSNPYVPSGEFARDPFSDTLPRHVDFSMLEESRLKHPPRGVSLLDLQHYDTRSERKDNSWRTVWVL